MKKILFAPVHSSMECFSSWGVSSPTISFLELAVLKFIQNVGEHELKNN